MGKVQLRRFMLVGLALGIVVAIAAIPGEEARADQDLGTESVQPDLSDPTVTRPPSDHVEPDRILRFDLGGPQAAWSLEQLTPAEQEIVLREPSGNSQEMERAYGAAAREQAARTAGERAQYQLGIELLDIGVVP